MLDLIMLFATCFLIGISLAVVVGPIALICMQQTLTHGFYAGIACGLGVATADGLYGAVAGFGLSFITGILHTYQNWLHLGGGLVLCYLGYSIFNRKIIVSSMPPTTTRLFKMYLSTCALTLSNPMTLIPLSAVLASIDLTADVPCSMLMVLLFSGFFCGSLAWWIILTSAVTLFRSCISRETLTMVNRIAGVLIGLFGGMILANIYLCTYHGYCIALF